MKHAEKFLALVSEARKNIQELSVAEVAQKLNAREPMALIDVREGEEFARGRLPGAISLCKGILERDIEKMVPDPETPIVLYCGGGFRSALAAENLQRMGYKKVWSMWGGWRAWTEGNLPVEK